MLEELLRDVKEMALHCGAIHMKYFCSDDVNIQSKESAHDLLTKADLECDKYLRETFSSKYPNAGVITEEGDNIPPKSSCPEEEIWFCADPLDGTNNFASGNPHFCISIGVLDYNHQPLVGVIYDACMKEMFWGVKGGGSFRESRRGVERLVCSTRTDLKDCELGSVIIGFPDERIRNAVETKIMLRHCQNVNERGSCCLDLCDVASGRSDGYWGYGPHIWDIAAGWIIATEAGCILTRMDGKGFEKSNLHSPKLGIVCAPPAIWPQIIDKIKTFPMMKIIPDYNE